MTTCAICEKPGDKRCAGCQAAFYCSASHQKEHWKQHKLDCRLFTIKKDMKYGRHVVASKDIEAGTIIMSESPVMIGPKQNTLPLCLGCYKIFTNPRALHYCSGCSLPMCGPLCEKVPLHAENECMVFSKYKLHSKVTALNPHHSYESIMTIRCLFLKKSQPKKWEQLNSMEPLNEFRKNFLHLLWHRNQVHTVNFLREHCKMLEFSEEEIHSVVGYADINAFEIKNPEIDILGIYNNCNLMSHDCVSNTHHAFREDYRMIVRASVPIKKGEMITTGYTNTMNGTLPRRADIRSSKFFDCDCQRCADPTELGTYFSAIKCSKCTVGYLLPTSPMFEISIWNCDTCENIVDVGPIQELLGKISNHIEMAQVQSTVLIIESHEFILKKYSGVVVHPNHYLMIKVIHNLTQFYGRVQRIEDLTLHELKRKESHCLHLLKVIDVIDPGLTRLRGITLYELQAAIFFASRIEFQNKTFTPTELKKRLEIVLDLISKAAEILSFDPPTSGEGKLAAAGPSNTQGVKDILAQLCSDTDMPEVEVTP